MTDSIRVDKWLWFARCCKTRSQAQRLVAEGLVTVNGRLVDKAAGVAPGDEVVVPVHPGAAGRGIRRLRVVALGARRGSPSQARALYAEVAAR